MRLIGPPVTQLPLGGLRYRYAYLSRLPVGYNPKPIGILIMRPKRTNGTENEGSLTTLLGGLQEWFDEFHAGTHRRTTAEGTAGEEKVVPGAFDRQGAADYLCVSVATVDQLRKSGRLKGFREGRKRLFRKAALDRYMAEEERRESDDGLNRKSPERP